MSLQGATGLIGTAIGLAALGLALGFVVKAGRGELFDGRDRDRRGKKGSRRRNDSIGFDFGGQGMTGGRRPKSSSAGIDNIFDLGLTQRPAKRKARFKGDMGSGTDFNIFAV